MEFLENILDGLREGVKHLQFRQLIHAERGDACEILGNALKNATPQDYDNLEYDLLSHSGLLVDPEKRVRAMELYGFLKSHETLRFGWRGYMTNGGPLG